MPYNQLLKIDNEDGVNSVAWSPDGTKIVSGSDDNTIRVWDVSNNDHIKLEGHTEGVWSVAWSPDGTMIVSGSEDKTIRIWDVSNNKHIKLEGHEDAVHSVAWYGNMIVSGSRDKTIRVWDVSEKENIKNIKTLKGHTEGVWSVAWSPDGTKIVSGSRDKTIRIWNTSDGEMEQSLEGHTDMVLSVAFNHDGTKIVSGSHDHTIRVWDTNTGGCLIKWTNYGHSINSAVFNHDDTKIAVASDSNTIYIVNIQLDKPTNSDWLNAELIGDENDDENISHTGSINSVAWSPDSTKIVSASDDATIRIWSETRCLMKKKDLYAMVNPTIKIMKDYTFYTYKLKDEEICVEIPNKQDYEGYYTAILHKYTRNNEILFENNTTLGTLTREIKLQYEEGTLEILSVYTGAIGICTKAVAYTMKSLLNYINKLGFYALDGAVLIQSSNPCAAFNCYDRAFRMNGFNMSEPNEFTRFQKYYEEFEYWNKKYEKNENYNDFLEYRFESYTNEKQKLLKRENEVKRKLEKLIEEKKIISKDIKKIKKLPPIDKKIKKLKF